MTSERWQQVDQLFEAALACPSGERAAFLAEACADDAALRQEVESLLRFHEPEDGFLESLPAALAADVVAGRDEWAGRRFGYYQIERRLGQGGMGVVYLARDTRLGRPVALKLLQPRFTQDPERVRRFRREARAASNLNHPNILTIYEVGQASPEDGGAHFIAAEFVAGETLRARITREPRPDEALDWAIQIAAALAAAHEAGVVHRDIKPENVMARPDGLVKVLDFGLAKLSRTTSDPHQTASNYRAGYSAGHSAGETRQGIVLGTVNYMSPEQARGEQVDARTDIFALGVMLYEIVAGRRPFTGPTDSHVLVAIQEQEPPPLAPAELQRVVGRMLAKDCAERFQTAEEAQLALKGLKRELIAPGDFSTRGFNRLARRFGYAGVGADTIKDTAEAPARATSGISLLIGRLIRSPFRGAVALATLALAITGVILGWQWLASRGAPVNSIAVAPSIAVLPFVNAGSDPRMEYLSDGITESLTRNLSQLSELRVMARGTVFTYKGREADPRQVGAALNVRAVVTGRVEQREDKLIIEVELADASDGARIWGERYQRPASDVLAVQEEIVRAVAYQLRLKLSGAQQQQLAKRYTEDTAAYRLYLQGRYHFLQYTIASEQKSLEYFQQAVTADPNYALAYTGIADVYAELSGQHLAPGEAQPKAREAALKALALDDTLAEARHSMAMVKWWADWDWPGAEREFLRALELNPNAAWTHMYYAEFLTRLKRFDEALVAARRGYELDPLSAPVNEVLGRALFYLGRRREAVEQMRKSLQLNPNYALSREIIARCFMRQGQYEEAIAEMRQVVAINQYDRQRAVMGAFYGIAGRRAEALEELAELKRRARRRRVSPVYLARVYAGLGDKKRALDLLYRGYAEHSDNLLIIGVDPDFDGLRSEPRFVELMRRVGLPQ